MKMKVLIVDDSKTIRHHEKTIVSELGYDVEEAVDGIDALRKIGNNKPHLVLMDIVMPNMDGIECCRSIKSDDALQEIKVIMVTTKDEYEKVHEAFKAGCDDYIIKPIDRLELLKKIDELSDFVRCLERLRT